MSGCVIDLLFEDIALPIHRPGKLLQLPAMVMVMETSSHGRGRDCPDVIVVQSCVEVVCQGCLRGSLYF